MPAASLRPYEVMAATASESPEAAPRTLSGTRDSRPGWDDVLPGKRMNPISPAAPRCPRSSRPPVMTPAPRRSPSRTNTISSAAPPTPRHCSPRAARLASFSTATGQPRVSLRTVTMSASAQPLRLSACRIRVLPRFTRPGVPTVAAHTRGASAPERSTARCTTAVTARARAWPPKSARTAVRSTATGLPSRSARQALTDRARTSTPTTKPACGRKRNRRAGRPGERWPRAETAGATSMRPQSVSSSTIASTVGRESLVASARAASRGCGSVERTAARMAAAFVARRSATPTTAGQFTPGGRLRQSAERPPRPWDGGVDGERSLDVANDQPPGAGTSGPAPIVPTITIQP